MNDDLGSEIVFTLGPLAVHEVVVTTWVIMLALTLASWLLTRQLRNAPARWQTALEAIVLAIQHAIASVDERHAVRLVPLIGTIWIFLVVANLLGIVPGLHSPTRDLSVTAALALVVFGAVHYYGIRINGKSLYVLIKKWRMENIRHIGLVIIQLRHTLASHAEFSSALPVRISSTT